MTQTLHILNGQMMYEYFRKTRFLNGEVMVPFNEAMCEGKVHEVIFSDTFAQIRANVHQVTLDQYKEITLQPLEPLLSKKFTDLTLWFDADMFCQMNILTILGWLDQIGYKGEIKLHIVGDQFELKENFDLKAEGYYQLYKQVFLEKESPEFVFPKPLRKGIDLYLQYLDRDSELVQYITAHQDIPEKELVMKLLAKFSHYGLGDTQYLKIIKSYRSHLK
ncbi:hypothetical protein [Bacillus niameyensis]|uniref:hypothetical protein n=1 Tax=Bacillus niameyensis TaxID=1522308 RepID=UPI0007832E10|nr:hypothetical protein [Bacillus niameyensis]